MAYTAWQSISPCILLDPRQPLAVLAASFVPETIFSFDQEEGGFYAICKNEIKTSWKDWQAIIMSANDTRYNRTEIKKMKKCYL